MISLFVLGFSLLAQGEMGQGLAEMAASREAEKESPAPAVYVITPSDRAKDYKEAFEYLKKMQPSAKPTFHLSDKTTITNISSIDLSTGGSLLIFRIGSTQGLKYKVVKVEDISAISQ